MKKLEPDQALRAVREAEELVYDVETTGLDRFDDRPVGFALYDPGEDAGAYVATAHEGGGNVPDADGFVEALAAAFRDRRGRVLGHHIKFDMHMSANVGIDLTRVPVHCTMNAQALCDEHARGSSLEALGERYGVQAKKSETMYQYLAHAFGGRDSKEQMSNFHRLPGNDAIAGGLRRGRLRDDLAGAPGPGEDS